ncbi:unnamed protein product [Boreogadus saida]
MEAQQSDKISVASKRSSRSSTASSSSLIRARAKAEAARTHLAFAEQEAKAKIERAAKEAEHQKEKADREATYQLEKAKNDAKLEALTIRREAAMAEAEAAVWEAADEDRWQPGGNLSSEDRLPPTGETESGTANLGKYGSGAGPVADHVLPLTREALISSQSGTTLPIGLVRHTCSPSAISEQRDCQALTRALERHFGQLNSEPGVASWSLPPGEGEPASSFKPNVDPSDLVLHMILPGLAPEQHWWKCSPALTLPAAVHCFPTTRPASGGRSGWRYARPGLDRPTAAAICMESLTAWPVTAPCPDPETESCGGVVK